MFLSEFIDKVYKLTGDLDSEIEIVDRDGNIIEIEDCTITKDYCNVITIHTGEY